MLDGAGQQPLRPVSPFAHYLSWLCEEFPGRFPTEVMAERERLPYGLLEEVVAARYYGRAHAANAANAPGEEASPLRVLAKDIEHELAVEEIGTQGDG